jgi:hypothetical protein
VGYWSRRLDWGYVGAGPTVADPKFLDQQHGCELRPVWKHVSQGKARQRTAAASVEQTHQERSVTTRELVHQFPDRSPVEADGVVIYHRRHKIHDNSFGFRFWTDVIDCTPSPAPEDRHVQKAAGDQHAAFVVPVPKFLALAWFQARHRVRGFIRSVA